jgi:ribosomal protein S18 acetylase RimI-like enzyme
MIEGEKELVIYPGEVKPMKISQRIYSGDTDQREMIQLAKETQAENIHIIDLPYRLSSWALDDINNVGLWTDENGELVAWAVMQTPFWTIDYVLRPDTDINLHSLILSWADKRAQDLISTPFGHPAWFVNVIAENTKRRKELEQNGYASQANVGEDAVWMERIGMMDIPIYPLPIGFTMRPLAGESEVAAYVELHQSVFETKNMTAEWRTRTLKHPDYIPELDVVVVAPDARLVAFCIGWISYIPNGGLHGQIEPLGCHADFRKFALGRVALCETLRRLRQHGAESIIVETDNYRHTAFRLYESVGFKVIQDILVYRKDYNFSRG